MSTIKSSLGTLAAVASLATPAVDAAVQISPISNEPLPASGTISLDIDGNGVVDFEINGDFQAILGTLPANGAVINGGGALIPLSNGALINGAETFNDSGDFDAFFNGDNQFAGFAFDRAGSTHYAWLEFSFPDFTFANGSVVRGAWEDGVDGGIEAGAIPEPSDAALAGGLLAGIVALIRRKFRKSKD